MRVSEKGLKIGTEKESQNGSQMTPQWAPKSTKHDPKSGVQQGLYKRTTLEGSKVRFCGYLLYFSGVEPLRRSSLLGSRLGQFWIPSSQDGF